MKIIAQNKGDLVRWRLVSMEVNQYERHHVFAGTHALKVFRMLIAKAASHSHREHVHRKIIAILDVAVAFFHADMEDKKNAHPPAEAEPDRIVVWLFVKAHYGTRKAARVWQEFLSNEVFMKAGWDAVAVEPNVYHKGGSLGDDDDACVCVHEDDFMVESRIDVFQDAKAVLEHKVGVNVISIIGPGQGTEAKIVKRILSWSLAGFTWKANPKHARDLIAWAGLEQSKAAAPSPGTAATTKTMRNALDELPLERANAVPSAGSTATHLAMDRPDIAYSIRRATQDTAKPKLRTEARLERVARYLRGEPERDANEVGWTGPDSEDQKCFSCVVVRFGEHVIDVVCSKQDVVSLSAPESEFYAMTIGGAHGIHTKNIFSDLQVEAIVRLDTDSTSASGMCRRRGVGRLRHLRKKEPWLQDQVAAKNVELGRVPSEDNETDLGTKYLERDRVKKCVTKMGMLFAGACAGEQLPVDSGTEVLIGEYLIEGQSWTTGVALLVTFGVVLLSCVVCHLRLPTGNVHVTREPAIAKQCSCMSPRGRAR